MSQNKSSCKPSEKAARSSGLKGRDKVKPSPVYYRILPDVFLARHLNEAELVDAQMVYHPIKKFCNRFTLGVFLAVSVFLFVVAYMCSKWWDLLVYADWGYRFIHIIYAIYHLLFPLGIYFVMKTRIKQAVSEHHGRQGKVQKWLSVLAIFYPMMVFGSYYLFRSSSFSNATVFGALRIFTFISLVSFLIWVYLALVRKKINYLLLCGAAGAIFALMQIKSTSTYLFEIGEYFFLLDFGLLVYFVGLGISILAFIKLQAPRKVFA